MSLQLDNLTQGAVAPRDTFGGMLRNRRRAAGLTQEELAERAGLSPRSISEVERGGDHVPRRDTIALLVRALDMSPTETEAFTRTADDRRARRAFGWPTHAPEVAPPVAPSIHNLPRSLTALVGREQELDQLASVLATAPLLTLLGPGGVGKTRLMLELARLHAADYSDGVWLVELAGIDHPAQLPAAIAAALRLELDGTADDVLAQLAEFLGVRHRLLVLDGCEHLVSACAEVVAHLLRRCPNAQVLATSREALAIGGEARWIVPPLDLHAAVRLFIARARAVNTSLRLAEEDLTAIARMCIRLEGMPLAIEHVAAQIRVLTVRQLADRLEGDHALIGSVMRTAIQRSYELLSDEQRTLLQRLSVFAGDWTLSLAELECGGSGIEIPRVLDLVTGLADRSMVFVDTTGAEAKYRLTDMVRVYAREQLEDSGDAPVQCASPTHAGAHIPGARSRAMRTRL